MNGPEDRRVRNPRGPARCASDDISNLPPLMKKRRNTRGDRAVADLLRLRGSVRGCGVRLAVWWRRDGSAGHRREGRAGAAAAGGFLQCHANEHAPADYCKLAAEQMKKYSTANTRLINGILKLIFKLAAFRNFRLGSE